MKVNSVKYITRESIKSIFKQKLMSIATVSIVTACFIILGVFLFLLLNANSMASAISNQPEVMVYCVTTLNDEEVSAVEADIKKNSNVKGCEIITREQAIEKVKKDLFEGNEELVESLGDMEFLPVSFSVKLVEPKKSEQTINELSQLQGVDVVKSPIELVNQINNVKQGISVFSWIVFIILLTISVLIVSNAIRLTVHARRREIGIMKYVGATDRFIKGPFVMEGTILGGIGSIIAFCVISYLYNAFIQANNISDVIKAYNIDFVHLNDMVTVPILNLSVYLGVVIFVIFLLVGVLMGIIGSIISIRKYLKV